MKTLIVLLASLVPLSSLAALDPFVEPRFVRDVDNPFARRLDQASNRIVDPQVLRQRLTDLGAGPVDTSQSVALADTPLLTDSELKDMQKILRALQAPPVQAESIDEQTLPLIARPLRDYSLRGVMVSFAQDPSVGREFDLLEKAQSDKQSQAVSHRVHVVRGLETLESISALYQANPSEVLIYNGFESAAEIQVGAPLLIPIDLTETNTFRVDEFYLQLGAYSDQRKAEEASNQARNQHESILLGDRFRVVPPEADDERQLFRLTVGPYSTRNIAENKCALLKVSGQGCVLRVEQRTPTEVVRGEVKATPSYVAVVGLRGDGEDFLVSEGDRLGNGGGVVVAIYDDRLVVQEGGLRAVLSMSQRELVGGMASVGGNGGSSIDPNAIASCNDLLLAAPSSPDIPPQCADSTAVVQCSSLTPQLAGLVSSCN